MLMLMLFIFIFVWSTLGVISTICAIDRTGADMNWKQTTLVVFVGGPVVWLVFMASGILAAYEWLVLKLGEK